MARILLAEDDEMVRTIVADALLGAGHAIACFEDGLQLLEAVHFRMPHMVILDCNMPVLSGIETLRQLRQIAGMSTLPVMMLTARDASSDQQIARYEGANAYVVKPVDPARLVLHVEALLEEAASMRDAAANSPRYRTQMQVAPAVSPRRLVS